MTEAQIVIQTLGFATGTALYVLLTVLLWRAEKWSLRPENSTRFSLLALLWNASNLIAYSSLLAGFTTESKAFYLSMAFAYSATVMLPTSLLLDLKSPQVKSARRRLIGKWAVRASYVIGALLALSIFATIFVPAFPLKFSTLAIYSAYNLGLHATVYALLFRKSDWPTRAERSYSFVIMLLLLGLAVGLMLLIHVASDASLEFLLGNVTQQWSIPLALVTFAFMAQFRFADLFVKRSLIILAAIITALIYGLFVVAPLTEMARDRSPHKTAAPLVVLTLLWCALLLIFPRLVKTLDRLADRLLFRRPDYRQIARGFSERIDLLEQESELFALAESTAIDALGAERASVVAREAGDHDDAKASEDEISVPVLVGGRPKYLMFVAPGSSRRKLLSDEMIFLSTLADRIGRRVEAIEFERERRERGLREARLQHSLTEAELRALRAQVNPHFLFNTLNTIVDLISSEPERAEAMTERLAEVFRYVLARQDRNLITIGEEFDFLRTYLEIEQARFGDRLRVVLEVDPAVSSYVIPSLILQPLVENAVKHGLAPKLEGGTIRVRAFCDAGFLQMTVEDDGAGWRSDRYDDLKAGFELPDRKPGPGGVGLRNVVERLRTTYGDRAGLDVRARAGRGTIVIVSIPEDETQNINHRRRGVGEVSAAEAAERSS
ncbi:MAG TPA: histidine kinase [Blastocatellia bacterium]|nr:histidine kinase [Blastocatellia bacterium]